MQNSMVMFTLTFFDRKHPFGAILVQKTKIDSFGLNVVPRIIRLCKVPWWRSLFLFSTGITVFGQILPKKSLDYFEYAKFMVVFGFSVLDRNYFFGKIWYQISVLFI